MPKKLKSLDIASFGDLTKALVLIADTTQAALSMAHTVVDSAEAKVEEHRSVMQAHLDRKDLRPRVNFKPLPKQSWAVAFNNVVYTVGPNPRFADMDEDDMLFLWAGPDNVPHQCKSMFLGLMAVIQDYCNVDPANPTEAVQ